MRSKAPSSLRFAGALQILAFTAFLFSATAHAQQPFLTDDADVTERHRAQLQISHEFDILPRSAHPALRQNTTVFVLNYGLLRDVEIGVDYPLIVISNSRGTTPKTIAGFGDVDFHVKYNFRKEHEGSACPAMTVSLAIEFPTGNAADQLGSGLTDYFLNGVLQKSLTKETKLRLNGGVLFAGSTSTGEVGIKTRGTVFVTSESVVKQFTPNLDLGVELVGAVERGSSLNSGQMQTQIGGNYQFAKNASFDFGVVAGKFNSPRVGLQLGVSIDF